MHATVCLLVSVQTIILMAGLLAGCLLCAYYVSTEAFTVGDYVLFTAYFQQLHEPLNLFGAYYRVLQNAFVDMENMFDLFDEPEEVQQIPYIQPLCSTTSKIKIENSNCSILFSILSITPDYLCDEIGRKADQYFSTCYGKNDIITFLRKSYSQ